MQTKTIFPHNSALHRGLSAWHPPLYTSPQTSPTPPTLTPPPPHPPIPLPRVTKERRTLRDTTLPKQLDHILSKWQKIPFIGNIATWSLHHGLYHAGEISKLCCLHCHQYHVWSTISTACVPPSNCSYFCAKICYGHPQTKISYGLYPQTLQTTWQAQRMPVLLLHLHLFPELNAQLDGWRNRFQSIVQLLLANK